MFPVIALAFETLPERYNPAIFNQFYESFPEGFLVAFDHQTLIGFLIGVKTTPNTARILMLSVQERYRNQGIGSTLLNQFLRQMKLLNVAVVELEVRASNQGALQFYKKQGFVQQELLLRFYQNGENAYRMSKAL